MLASRWEPPIPAPMHDPPEPATPAPAGRGVNGILVLLVLIGAGLSSTSLYYHWKAPKLIAAARAARAALPESAEERLAVWLEYCAPSLRERLVQLRFSAREPWLVTHWQAGQETDGAGAIYGLDLQALGSQAVRREGLTVVVELPPPARLGTGTLRGDRALSVERATLEPTPEQIAARAREVVLWAISRLSEKLPQDIPGAHIELRIDARGPLAATNAATSTQVERP